MPSSQREVGFPCSISAVYYWLSQTPTYATCFVSFACLINNSIYFNTQQEEIAALEALKEADPGLDRSSDSDSSDSEVVSFRYDSIAFRLHCFPHKIFKQTNLKPPGI